MKPLFFPEGGLRYFLAAASIILVAYFIGRLVEARILKA